MKKKLNGLLAIFLSSGLVAAMPVVIFSGSAFLARAGMANLESSAFGGASRILKVSSFGFGLSSALAMPLARLPIGEEFGWMVDQSAELSVSTRDASETATILSLLEDQSLEGREVPNLDSLLYALPFRSQTIDPQLSDFSRLLVEVVGVEEAKTWAFVFQNTDIVRPTGGAIEEVAIVRLDRARVMSYDLYSADDIDNDISGFVSPPAAIRENLGTDSWSFRDANWDPDFRRSAERIAWFIDKALGLQVDGVIALNSGFADAVSEKGLRGFEAMVKFTEALEAGDMQFALSSPEGGPILAKQGWDGSLPSGEFWASLVEADFSSRAPVDGISKKAEITGSRLGEVREYSLSFSVANSGESPYVDHIRLLLPRTAKLIRKSIGKGSRVIEKKPLLAKNGNHTESPELVVVAPGQSVTVSFVWREEGGEALAFIRQPGSDYSILTSGDVLSYNTEDQPRILYLNF